MNEAILITLIAAIAPTAAVIVSAFRAHKKLEEIHVLVNGRLAIALKEIEDLKRKVEDLKNEV